MKPRNVLLSRMLAALAILGVCMTPAAADELLIDLGDALTPADCRKPSRVPASVDDARAQRPCRQMKLVQHWLNFLVHESTFASEPEDFGQEVPNTEDDDLRRQYFFGRYWRTIDELNVSAVVKRDIFEGVLRTVFPRLWAVLIASENPIDRRDAEAFGIDEEDWWWELPDEYASVPDSVAASGYDAVLEFRASRMRDDVNLWIQRSGLRVLSDAGTADQVKKAGEDPKTFPGDYDFILVNVIMFMYQFKDVLDPPTLEVLVVKNWPLPDDQAVEFNISATHGTYDEIDEDPGWGVTNVPFSGQSFARELYFVHHVAANDDYVFTETENHVLNSLTHYYLMNQWIFENEREARSFTTTPDGWTHDEWFSYQGNQLADWMRDAVARIIHLDFFETNARPYQHISLQPLLALASHARDEIVRVEAQNALHFLATKFAFQSMDGRRYTPMRRNCQRAYSQQLYLYNGDLTALAIGAISGAYKWNDSPYGYRLFRDADAGQKDACVSGEIPDCYWPQYTWKSDPLGNDALGEQIAATADQLDDDLPAHILRVALYAAFSGYEVPRATHDFMLHKYDGYYARMMPQFDRGHYRYHANKVSKVLPRYFDGDAPADAGDLENERTPEFYCAGPGFLNVAGGIYNPFQLYLETTYVIPSNPLPTFGGGCHGEDKALENYDFLSRPYAVVPEVPTVVDEDTGEILYYKPFGTLGQKPVVEGGEQAFSVAEANQYMPLMLGDSDHWFKSANISTYKNFSYGYRIRNTGVGLYAKLGLEFPMYIPEDWRDPEQVPMREFDIGDAAVFRVYDVREYLEGRGQTGFYLVTARVRKYQNTFWSTRVARGFWEVVPGALFDDLAELEEAVKADNDPDWFKLGHGGPFSSGKKDFRYRLVTSGEVLRLDQKYGAVFLDFFTLDGGRVQGILGVSTSAAPDTGDDFTDDDFIDFMDNDRMNALPLMEVMAVDERFRWLTEIVPPGSVGGGAGGLGVLIEPSGGGGGANGPPAGGPTVPPGGDAPRPRREISAGASRTPQIPTVPGGPVKVANPPPGTPVIYCCARDGWLAVNNVKDGSYLFVESRRGPGFEEDLTFTTPYWVSGTFSDDRPWGVACDGTWIPRPPDNGVPEDCSRPGLCAGIDPDGPHADLQIVKFVEVSPPATTRTAEYTIKITNLGSSPALNVVVSDKLGVEHGVLHPIDEDYLEADFGGVWSNETETEEEESVLLEATIPVLPVSATATLKFSVVVQSTDSDPTVLINTANVTSNLFDPNQQNNSYDLTTSLEF